MPISEELQEQLLPILLKLDFDRKYYDFYARAKTQDQMRFPYASFVDTLSRLPDLRHIKKERFFERRETAGGWLFKFKLAYLHGSLELILYISREEGMMGGTVHGLAYETGKLRDPTFDSQPPYPKLPFHDRKTLEEAVTFAFSLYEEVKGAVLAYPEWPEE